MRVFFLLVTFLLGGIATERAHAACTEVLQVEQTIGPAALDYWRRGVRRAEAAGCSAILLEINTPGGSLQTTRIWVEEILAAKIPVLCLVSPSGGHAGSAGAIIMQACQVNGMMPGTNLGAATPISMSEKLGDDLRKKIIQDTESMVRSLAQLRGRNVQFATEIVSQARAVSADEALQLKAVDTVVADRETFLAFARGRLPQVGTPEVFQLDLRFYFLNFVTDPEFAYLLFMASLALLYFEFTHPGVFAPGVAGALGLVISLIAFHKLEVTWGGLALIILGVGFLVAEAFVPSFGALGVGGIIALASGSLLLFDPARTGASLPVALALSVALGLGVSLFGLALFIYRTRRRVGSAQSQSMLGLTGAVKSLEAASSKRGMAYVRGEYWRFVSEQEVKVGEVIEVVSMDGLTLSVRPLQRS